VLSTVGNDYQESSTIAATFELRIEEQQLDYRFDLANEGIRQAIETGQARLVLSIYSAGTMFRDAIPVTDFSGTIELQAKNLWGAVEFMVNVIATQDIDAFVPTDKNPLYSMTDYFINKGAPLAISPVSFSFVTFDKRDFKNLIHVSVDESYPPGTYAFQFERDKITMIVDPEIKQLMNVVNGDLNSKPFGFMSYYKDCLVAALTELRDGDDYDALAWATSLTKKVDQIKEAVTENSTYDDLNRIALRLVYPEGTKKVIEHA
jgi:hypothetical protein